MKNSFAGGLVGPRRALSERRGHSHTLLSPVKGGKADVSVPVVRYEKFFGRGAGQRSRTRKGHRTNILCLLFNNPQEECSGILSGLPRTVPELKLSCLLLHCTRSEAIFFLVCQERFRNFNFNDNSSPALDLRQFFFWFAKNGSVT